jgi:nitroimidazol reductase NimA-like FMN-containing flavoprotein (pyridoxamine 5'-phosphate oxidase superfamily)
MLVKELSRRECHEMLARLGFGRLACARENQPYIVPVYFAYETDRLYGFATMGQKVEWLRANPRVCIEADEVKSHNDWASVIVQGRYEEFPDTPKYVDLRKQAQTALEKRSLWWQTGFASAQTRGSFDRDIPVFYCVHIEEISGHRAAPDPVEASFKHS